MANKVWVNPDTGAPQTSSPWGSGWVCDSRKQEYLNAGWKQEDIGYISETPLIEVKAAKKLDINAKRNDIEQSGFIYLGKTIQSDSVSVTRITIAVQAAQTAISQNTASAFSLEWMCADNTTLTLTAAQTVAMSVALASFGQSLHTTATILKEKVDACTTVADVEAIKIVF